MESRWGWSSVDRTRYTSSEGMVTGGLRELGKACFGANEERKAHTRDMGYRNSLVYSKSLSTFAVWARLVQQITKVESR